MVLKSYLREQLNAQYPMFREGTVKSPFAKAQFEIIADLGGYLKLTINNPSSKKMTGITVYLKDPLGLKSEFLF
jgi:hypothetical protein